VRHPRVDAIDQSFPAFLARAGQMVNRLFVPERGALL
jgi:hypothetical protein